MNRRAPLLLTCTWGAIVLCLSGCKAMTAPEKHLIPEDYRGQVFIVAEVSRGASPQREGRWIVFDIPENGILLTQDSLSSGWHRSEFYLVDSKGERRRLGEDPRAAREKGDNEVYVAARGYITLLGGDLSACDVQVMTYYVGTAEHRRTSSQGEDEVRLEKLLRERGICS